MQTNRLTALEVKRETKPGLYSDGNNLYLQVTAMGCKSWVFRYCRSGKARMLGLGPVRLVSLAEARAAAFAACRSLHAGIDPLADKQAKAAAAAPRHTFRDAAASYVADHAAEWGNSKHRAQWPATLEIAHAVIGNTDVAAITTNDIVSVLRPIWTTTHTTAARLRGRIESVLDAATARGWRSGDNPARLAGNLAHLLPSTSKLTAVTHHPALAWSGMPGFMAEVQGRVGTAALALRFTILTAARAAEAVDATWAEIDLANSVWTVPATRMKADREHRVPLSQAALGVLVEARTLAGGKTEHVFPGRKTGKALTTAAMLVLVQRHMNRPDLTVHGFRSTFRDWAAEATNHDHDPAEAALAHTVRDKVVAAYKRGDLLDKRRPLMQDWARHCGARE